jgi:hypothetical protein
MAGGDNHTTDPRELNRYGFAAVLYDVESYFRATGTCEFAYDEELDVYRFPHDGGFAFCREFADWGRLIEWGYWTPPGSGRP